MLKKRDLRNLLDINIKMNINDYDIYIFDLDGTIIDSEKIHYQSYNNQLNNSLSFKSYCDIFHTNKKEEFIKENKIDIVKKEQDFKELYELNGKLIDGFEVFFKSLINSGKITCIVTNSNKKRCEFIKSLHPILNYIDLWITKDDIKYIKPNPEGYIKAIQYLTIDNNKLEKIVIFEDSYIGLESIKNIPYITKIFMNTNDYDYNYKLIYKNYNNIISDFSIEIKDDNYNIIFNKYENALNLLKKHSKKHICSLIPLIINKTIFITGIGKSGLIAKKCISTWNSMGISAFFINNTNLHHGDYGKLMNDNSVIIYLSNSGNTEELIKTAKYIKNEIKICKILISNNNNNKLKEFCDYNFSILDDNLFYEIDDINMCPTTSSLIYLSFLDILGIEMRKMIGHFTKKDFIKYHPEGQLGLEKKIDSVVIVACGKGTRLLPYTKEFPKCLFNLDNDNILTNQINYWSKYTNSFIIVIENKYNNLIEFYCNLLSIDYKIINVNIDNNQENSYTIQESLKEDYLNKNLIITWCDILFTEELDLNKLNTNIIFTFGNDCRYTAKNNELIKTNTFGNVIGCFYIKDYHPIKTKDPKLDFCDIFIENFGNFDIYELKNVIDIGDLKKVNNYRENNINKYKTRYFNFISETTDGYLKKEALNNYGYKLISNEKKFYKMISLIDNNNIKNLFPSIIKYENNYFIMEKIKGLELYKTNNNDYLELVLNNLNELHNSNSKSISKEEFDINLKKEFYDKIIERYDKIKVIIDYLNITSVNNIKIIKNFQEIFKILFNDIKQFYFNKKPIYNIIHGDCSYSNILITDDNKIKLIDPRGYFGNSLFYGIKEYDYSKVLYSLSGYDEFNTDDNYYLEYDNNNINLRINNKDLLQYKNKFNDFDICLKMIIIHWFGLAEYNKNNIHKCITSFYYGLYLYHKYYL